MMRTLTTLMLSLFLLACQAQDTNEPTTAKAKAPVWEDFVKEQEAKKWTPEEAARVKKEVYELARKNNGGKEPTKQDLWKALVQKAEQAAGSTNDYGNYRQVKRGAKPEIIVKLDGVEINGTSFKFGASKTRVSMDDLKKALVIPPLCDSDNLSIYCVWNDLGISAGTEQGNKGAVSYFGLNITPPPPDPYAGLVSELPDGTPASALPDYGHEKPFTGYLEVDGYGIDTKTQYWEIESNIDVKRKLHCGFEGCAHADGIGISMTLNRNNEKGNIQDIQFQFLEKPIPED